MHNHTHPGVSGWAGPGWTIVSAQGSASVFSTPILHGIIGFG